jgi:anti-sigma factor RsiW
MNCTEARDLLPALLYGHAPSTDAEGVRTHLSNCAACRGEFAELERVRRALDSVPAPAVAVDLPRIFQEAAAVQQRRARRWRRATVAACALAASLLIVVLMRLEVRADANQLVVRWGDAPKEQPLIEQPRPEPTVIVQREVVFEPEVEGQVRILRDMVHALAGSIENRDAQLVQILALLKSRFDTLQVQDTRRWSENDKNFAALYKAVFFPKNSGENQ